MQTRKHANWQWFICLFAYLPICLFGTACGDDDELGTPRPRGYFRINFPEKEYVNYGESCPFVFAYPKYAKIEIDKAPGAEPCWLNVEFPHYRGTLHLSYKKVDGNIAQYLEDARGMAVTHQVKADAIEERMVINKEAKVFGLVYDIEGNAASNVQFYLTDSTKHFVRGALYFTAKPNKDSLAPVIQFIREDVFKLIDSFRWLEAKEAK